MNPARGATGLTRKLFDMLKPGGRLVVGNFLKPGRENMHCIHHQFMMEAYSDWKLIYRTLDEVNGFASTIPTQAYVLETRDETLQSSVSPKSVIGFLILTRWLEATGQTLMTSEHILAGKRGLVVGAANAHSIAWAIARSAALDGASIGLTYQGETLRSRIAVLEQAIAAPYCIPCDLTSEADLWNLRNAVKAQHGKIDFIVHSVAFADKQALAGRFNEVRPRPSSNA